MQWSGLPDASRTSDALSSTQIVCPSLWTMRFSSW